MAAEEAQRSEETQRMAAEEAQRSEETQRMAADLERMKEAEAESDLKCDALQLRIFQINQERLKKVRSGS